MAETPESLEGRIIAHRKILARLVAAVATGRGGKDLLDYLEDRRHLALHEEDPGAVPDPGLAVEGAIADEVSLVLDLVRSAR